MDLKNNASFEVLDETLVAFKAALKAGEKILEIYQNDFKVENKDDKGLLTEADTASNEILIKELSKFGHPILSEESVDDLNRLKSVKVWIIDPLDGTADFIDQTGEFSVMIALVKEAVPIMGVVYQPTKNVFYIGQKGNGAYKVRNNTCEKIYVSKENDLSQIRAVLSRHHLQEIDKTTLDNCGIKNFIRLGSAGLKIGWISEGKADLYVTSTSKIKQWDTAAAHCIILEAGGSMTDVLGNDLVYNTDNVYHMNGILASNCLVHDSIVQKYKKLIHERINTN